MDDKIDLDELQRLVMGLKDKPLREFTTGKNRPIMSMAVDCSTWIPEEGFPDGGFYVDARVRVYTGTAKKNGPTSDGQSDEKPFEIISAAAYFYDGEEKKDNKVIIEDFDPGKYGEDISCAAFEEANARV